MRNLLIVSLLGVSLLGALWFAGAQDLRSPWAAPTVLPPEEPIAPAPTRGDVKNPAPAKVPSSGNGKPAADATMIIPAEVFDEPRPLRPTIGVETPTVVQTGVQAPSMPVPKPIELPTLENKRPANPPPPMFPGATPAPALPALEPKATPAPKPAPITPPPPALEPKDVSGSSSVDAIIVVPPVTPEALKTPNTEPVRKEPLPLQASPLAVPEVPVMPKPVAPVVVPTPIAVPEPKPAPPVVVMPSPVMAPEAKPAPPVNAGPKAFVPIRPASRPGQSMPIQEPKPLPPMYPPQPTLPIGPITAPPSRDPGEVQLQTPALVVEKRQSANRLGDTLQYQIVVRNLSSFPAQQVRIEDEIPLDARLTAADPAPEMQGGKAIWVLPTVAPGSEQVIRLTVQTSAGEISHRTSVHVSAAASAKPALNHSAFAVPPRNQAEALAVRLLAPTHVAVGKPVVFDIQVTNQADQPCNGMVLFGRLPDGLTHPEGQNIKGPFDGTLQPGETKTLRMPATAVKPGRYTVEVKIATHTGYEATATANIEIDVDTLRLAQALNARLFVGREGDYRIELTNHTSRSMRNIAIANQLAEGLEFVAASDRGLYQANRRAVHWLVDELPPGRTRTLTMRVHATKVGQYQQVVTAKADGSPEVRSVGTIMVEGISGLSMKVIDRDNPLEVGRETVYEIQVANPGTTPSTNVKLQVQFPPGLTPRKAEGNTRHAIDQQTVTFDPLPALGPNGEAIYRVSAVAQAPGDQRVRFAIVSDQAPTPITREKGTWVYRD